MPGYAIGGAGTEVVNGPALSRVVQCVTSDLQVTGSPTVTITVKAGSTIILFIACTISDNRSVSSIADSHATPLTMTQVQTRQFDPNTSACAQCYIGYNAAAGAHTFTLTMSASSTYDVLAIEVDGVLNVATPLDVSAAGNTGNTAVQTLTLGPITTTQPNELLVCVAYGKSSSRPYGAITGWTNALNDTGAASYIEVWWKNVAVAGANSITMSSAPFNQNHYGYLMALKDAAEQAQPQVMSVAAMDRAFAW